MNATNQPQVDSSTDIEKLLRDISQKNQREDMDKMMPSVQRNNQYEGNLNL